MPYRLSFLFFVIIAFSLTALHSAGVSDAPASRLDRSSHDFGLIIPFYGNVETDFLLANDGTADLVIKNLSTSCTCTTVSSDRMTLKPGESTRLTVVFDPMAHRGVSGDIRRMVYVETNDSESGELTIEITGFVDFGDSSDENETKDPVQTQAADDDLEIDNAVIYYNEACGMCVDYLENDLYPLTGRPDGENVRLHDYINDREFKYEMTDLYRSAGIHPAIQSHILTMIGDNIFLGGHVEPETIEYLLSRDLPMERIYIAQDEMEDAVSYIAWDFESEPVVMDLNDHIEDYINEYGLREKKSSERKNFLPLVLTGGFVDGVNPCAFTVLIFFILFLYSMKRNRGPVIAAGIIFISAVFLSYLLIGLGILQTFKLLGSPHLIAKISSGLLIIMGLINIKDFFWYGRGFSLSPHWLDTAFFKKHLTGLTVLSTFAAGFIVGLCTFPCTGGVYVAILGILTAETTFASGLVYLVLYNLAFVMPLILILISLTNRRSLGAFMRWENRNKKTIKLFLGIILILIGALLLLWL